MEHVFLTAALTLETNRFYKQAPKWSLVSKICRVFGENVTKKKIKRDSLPPGSEYPRI